MMKSLYTIIGTTLVVAVLIMGCKNQWVETDSGLKFIDHEIGMGEVAAQGATIKVHYRGWLYNDDKTRGDLFDSSKTDSPLSFQLGIGRVIKGWDEGVIGMKVGGKRELIIPADLAYGDRGAGNVIPPGATLDFEVELLEIEG